MRVLVCVRWCVSMQTQHYQSITRTGMPPAGLVKGGASKTLKMNLDKYKVGLQRPQSGQRPQSAAGTLFYGQNPGRTTPFPGRISTRCCTL